VRRGREDPLSPGLGGLEGIPPVLGGPGAGGGGAAGADAEEVRPRGGSGGGRRPVGG
jgi:hypothetical protein